MSWGDRVLSSLDQRATVLHTGRGAVQVGRAGQGPPVLVLHGGPGGFDQGLAWSWHLQHGGCEVLALSRPGYLRTPLESGRRPEDQADLCAAILDTLHIERATIFGFSTGGPAATHFAARHPDRTTALLLDSAVLLPFLPPTSVVQRATYETSFFVWLSSELVMHKPRWMAALAVSGMADGLDRETKTAAIDWITADPTRLQSLQEQFASTAPWKHRRQGWTNDKANERDLRPLPFVDITAPTLVAAGTNDSIVPIEHSRDAADRIPGAELVVVAEGFHTLSLSRHYEPVARRQLELAHR